MDEGDRFRSDSFDLLRKVVGSVSATIVGFSVVGIGPRVQAMGILGTISVIAGTDVDPANESGGGLGSQLVVGMIVAIVGGVFAYILYDRWADRVRIKIVRDRRRQVDRFLQLYVSAIEELDRISPDKITSWLQMPWYSPGSFAAFGRAFRDTRNPRPLHLLVMTGTRRGGPTGFVKLIGLPKSNQIYIGYVGALSGSSHGVDSSAALLRAIEKAVKSARTARVVSFEIMGEGTRAVSRHRLFSDYARQHGYTAQCMNVYPAPTHDFRDGVVDQDHERGVLCFVDLVGCLASEPEVVVESVLEDVYFGIYAYMYRKPFDAPGSSDEYLAARLEAWRSGPGSNRALSPRHFDHR